MNQFLYKYGCREHLEQFIERGLLQIGTVYSYDEATHGPAIGDDAEGLSHQAFTDENTREMIARGDPLPVGPWGTAIFGSPGSYGNVVIRTNVSFNYAVFSSSRVIHRQLCKNFSDKYDCAFVIMRPYVFFHEVSKAFEASGCEPSIQLQQVEDICYRDRAIGPDEEVVEAFVKEPRYGHQREVRAIWNVGEKPSQPFYRFDAPEARRCCRLIPFDSMPDYEPGSSPEVCRAQVMRAIDQSEGYSI